MESFFSGGVSVKFISIRINSGARIRTASKASFGPETAFTSNPARFNKNDKRIEWMHRHQLSKSYIILLVFKNTN